MISRPSASVVSFVWWLALLSGPAVFFGTDATTPPAAVGQEGGVLAGACAGDCNGDGRVTVDELVVGVNVALGQGSPDQCANLDRSGDQTIDIDELVGAVYSAMVGCAPAPNVISGQGVLSPATTVPTLDGVVFGDPGTGTVDSTLYRFLGAFFGFDFRGRFFDFFDSATNTY